jgi:hypothetical protein
MRHIHYFYEIREGGLPLFTELPRKVLLGIYIYNGVKSEKHALFQNPVSGSEVRTSSKPPHRPLKPQR